MIRASVESETLSFPVTLPTFHLLPYVKHWCQCAKDPERVIKMIHILDFVFNVAKEKRGKRRREVEQAARGKVEGLKI